MNEATPIESPTMILAIISTVPFQARAHPRDPRTKQEALIMREYFLPNFLVSLPEIRAPAVAPPIMDPTTHEMTLSLTPRSCLIKSLAWAMTPMSMPNRRPASAAIKHTKNTVFDLLLIIVDSCLKFFFYSSL